MALDLDFDFGLGFDFGDCIVKIFFNCPPIIYILYLGIQKLVVFFVQLLGEFQQNLLSFYSKYLWCEREVGSHNGD